jgi:hypothetical protein
VATATAATDEERLARYTPIAQAAWADTWCGPGTDHPVTVRLHTDTPGFGNLAYAMVARDGQYVCEVRIKDGFEMTQSPLSDVEFCRVLVHEYGHLAGVEHTTGGLMDHFAAKDTAYAPCETGVPQSPATSTAFSTADPVVKPAARRCKAGKRFMWGRCR